MLEFKKTCSEKTSRQIPLGLIGIEKKLCNGKGVNGVSHVPTYGGAGEERKKRWLVHLFAGSAIELRTSSIYLEVIVFVSYREQI